MTALHIIACLYVISTVYRLSIIISNQINH